MQQLRKFSLYAAKDLENHSEYGDMMNTQTHTRVRTHKTKYTDMHEVNYINNQTKAKTLLKKLD